MEHLKCNEMHLNNPYSYRPEIEKELLASLPARMLSGPHPTRVVRMASNVLKLNLLQCALLGWLLRRSNYSLNDLNSSAISISVALFLQDQNKALLLLIMLNAYHVKSFLNKTTSPQIDSEVLELIPQFAKIYNSWRPESMLKDASLEELNEIFSRWSLPGKKSKPDYNKLVNRILDLSKTYNVAGNDQEIPKKKIKLNAQQQEAKPKKAEVFQESPSQQEINLMNKSNSMMLRSSRMNRNNHTFANINFDYLDQNEDGFMINNSIRRSSRLKNKNCYFDLQNSLGGAAEFPSQQLNNTVLRSTFRIQNNTSGVRSLLFSNLKRTVSNDIIKE